MFEQKESGDSLSKNLQIFEKFKKSEGWQRIAKLWHSKVLMEISSQRLIFVSVNTELSGRFVEIINLGFVKPETMTRTLASAVNHIMAIRRKYLKDPKTENVIDPNF